MTEKNPFSQHWQHTLAHTHRERERYSLLFFSIPHTRACTWQSPWLKSIDWVFWQRAEQQLNEMKTTTTAIVMQRKRTTSNTAVTKNWIQFIDCTDTSFEPMYEQEDAVQCVHAHADASISLLWHNFCSVYFDPRYPDLHSSDMYELWTVHIYNALEAEATVLQQLHSSYSVNAFIFQFFGKIFDRKRNLSTKEKKQQHPAMHCLIGSYVAGVFFSWQFDGLIEYLQCFICVLKLMYVCAIYNGLLMWSAQTNKNTGEMHAVL